MPDPLRSDSASGASAGAAAASNPGYIALLKPAGVSWNGGKAGAPTLVPYSFAARGSGHYASGGAPAREGFDPAEAEPLDAAQRASIERALSLWESASGLVFVEVPDPADLVYPGIRFLLEDLGDGAATALTRSDPPAFADVFFAREHFADDPMRPGTYGFLVAVHEIGHAIGLKHPFEGAATLPPGEDTTRNTVMSYTDGGNHASLGPLDVAAVRHLYGTQEAEAAAPVRWRLGPDGSLVSTGDGDANAIAGLAIRDVVHAGAGDDRVDAAAGDDEVWPGPGDDTVLGGAGADTLVLGVRRGEAEVALRPGGGGGTVATADGTDRFDGVETIRFLDGDLAVGDSGEAGRTVAGGAGLGRAEAAVASGSPAGSGARSAGPSGREAAVQTRDTVPGWGHDSDAGEPAGWGRASNSGEVDRGELAADAVWGAEPAVVFPALGADGCVLLG